MKFKRTATVIVLLSSSVLIFYFYYASVLREPYFSHPDGLDHAQIAREISRGNGFKTLIVFPPALVFYKQRNINLFDNWPDITRLPFTPFMMAFFFTLFGENTFSVILSSSIFFIMTIPVILFLGEKISDYRTGLLSSLIFLFNFKILDYGLMGQKFVAKAFLFTLLVFTIYNAKNRINYITSGIILGLIFWVKYYVAMILFIPLNIYIYYTDKKNWVSILLFCISFIAVILPWSIRNFIVTGSPFFSLLSYIGGAGFTAIYPGLTLFMKLDLINLIPFVFNYPLEMLRKFLIGLKEFISFFPSIMGLNYLLPFFIVDIFIIRQEACRKLKILFYSIFLFSILGFQMAYVIYGEYHYLLFVPLIIIFSVNFFFELLDKINFKRAISRRIVVFIFFIFAIAPNIFFLREVMRNPGLSVANTVSLTKGDMANIKYISGAITKNEVVLTPKVYPLAWYGNVKALYPVVPLSDIEKINREYLRVDWAFVPANELKSELWAQWLKWEDLTKYGYKLVKVFEDGGLLYKLDENYPAKSST